MKFGSKTHHVQARELFYGQGSGPFNQGLPRGSGKLANLGFWSIGIHG